MKTLFICMCCALCLGASAQETVTKSYPAQAGEQINLRFDYPVVKISTWDKNEVSVVAHVDINDHENDNAFELEQSSDNGEMTIRDHFKDMDNIPRRYTIVRNGVKTVYKSKEAFREAQKEPGVEQSYEGTNWDVTLEIKIPSSCTTNLHAIYGIVEMTNFNAPAIIEATYGGIDATISTPNTGKLKATTHYGQIYSNLDLKITDHTEQSFFHSITAEPGKGPSYELTSDYGKIYLRKP